MRRLRPELWLLHHDNTLSHISFLHQGIFKQKQFDCLPHPSFFSLFPRLNIKLKGSHFDTTEAIKVESQAVLNTLTEHDFQDAFKKGQKHWEQCILAEGDYFEGDGGQ
jgi:hypothetical protein